ncbi:IEC3 subunit of the Ino80 complex, chromatin re-modelling-domain-containing protein [Apodospora peruviana]|uniref:IEC3 subunit of the Ino80 complex, chromatin re-modelling-domain-containing protein n=1 Tax=Apodospora peruviana TaxID=516989 RepID=A0AAE0I1B0_9PEZI|nr:IEC3 subunit of the Ino80 complex, chromatin re-modelling-domain-containing protein [Apodospora peruviana]
MDLDARSRTDLEVKAEDDSGDTRMADDRPTYRSWKKKYRKMRIVFDQKMHEGEELHRTEQKALATARRLAVQKDRLLDLLLDVNNSAQIPPEKRFDLSLDPPSDDDEALCLDIDRPSTPLGDRPLKSYKRLLQEVGHLSYASAAEHFPKLLADLEAGRDSPADPSQGISHPPSFLNADEIDNYIYEVDMRLANQEKNGGAAVSPMLPTLAPLAHANGNTANGALNHAKEGASVPLTSNRDFALRNPTSVYNWLRKHAPKTFLQDGEAHPEKDKDKGDHDEHHHTPGTSGRGGRGKGERGSTRGGGSIRSKRMSKAAAATAAASHGDDYDEEMVSYEPATPTVGAAAGGGKGKRKRIIDEDPGYRPKGGSSRPTKKKRKSEGGGEGSTPTAAPSSKRSRKSGGATHAAIADD